MKRIHFKSTEFFYNKEKEGLKSNTVREVGECDTRFEGLMEMIQTKDYGLIVIHLNTDYEGTFFERQITDISYYDEKFIISWNPEETFSGTVTISKDGIFHGIDCMENDEQYGFFKSVNDVRPSSATWIDKANAEHLWNLFSSQNLKERCKE